MLPADRRRACGKSVSAQAIFAQGEVLLTQRVVFGGGDIERAGLAKPLKDMEWRAVLVVVMIATRHHAIEASPDPLKPR